MKLANVFKGNVDRPAHASHPPNAFIAVDGALCICCPYAVFPKHLSGIGQSRVTQIKAACVLPCSLIGKIARFFGKSPFRVDFCILMVDKRLVIRRNHDMGPIDFA